MNICNIKTRRATQAAIKALEGILPVNVATACIVTNNGHSMDFSPRGEESILYQDLHKITNSVEQALQAKALIYSNLFREWFGDWTDPEVLDKSVAVDEKGEPKLYYYGTDNVSTNSLWRPGAIYYTSVEDALAHNQYAIPVYLNARAPLNTDYEVINPDLGDSTYSEVLGTRTVFSANQVMKATEQDSMFDRHIAYNISPALKYQNLYNILQGNIVAWSNNNLFEARRIVKNFNNQWHTNFGLYDAPEGFRVIKSNYFAVLQDSMKDDIEFREDHDFQRINALVAFLHEKFPNIKYQFLEEAEYIHEFNQIAPNAFLTPNSFIKGDTIYFSKLRVTTDVAAEEFLHPLVYTLKYNTPDLFAKLYREAQLQFNTLEQEVNWTYKTNQDEELVTQALARTFRQEFETQPRKKFLDYIKEFFAWVRKVFTDNVYFNPDLKKFFLTTDNLAVENLQQLAEILNTEDTYIDVWPVGGVRANWGYDRATIGQSEAKYVTEETRPVLDSKLNISAQDAYEVTSLIDEIYKIKFNKETAIKVTDEDYWNKLVPVLNKLGLADYASEIFLEGGEKDGDDFYIDAQAAKLLKQLWDKVSKSKDLLKFTNDFIENYYVDDGIEKGRAAVGLRLQYRYNDARQLSLFDEQLPKVDNVTSQALQGYVNHSGGAVGSDTYWGEVGARFGVTSNHYYHGNKTPNGNVAITEEQFQEGKAHVLQANETLNRKPEKYMDLLARNWMQVKNADAVFAIGHISKGIVDGGTGWAVQMAIDAGKPVYLFDQVRNQWFRNTSGTWAVTEVPTLTSNFAGIGTRELNEQGKKAIEDVYAKTLQHLQISASQTEVPPLVITGSAKTTEARAKEIDGIDTLRHPDAQGMHFGNPFSHLATGTTTAQVKVPTVREAVQDFEMWLRGTAWEDVEPERRQWILDKINSGELDGKPLVYYTDKIPDNSYGRSTYDYNEAPNHAHILQKLILEHQQSATTQETEIHEAVVSPGFTAWQVLTDSKEQKLKDFLLYVTGNMDLFNRLMNRNNTKQDREKAFREVKEWMKAWQAREAELLELGYTLGEVPLITEGKAKGHYNFRQFFKNLDIRHSFEPVASDFTIISNYQKHAAEAVIPKIYRTQLKLGNTSLADITPAYFERVNNYYRSEFNDVEVIVRTDSGKFSISKIKPQNATPVNVLVREGYRIDKQGNRMYRWPEDATLYIGDNYGEECIVLNTHSDTIAVKEIN